MFVRAPKDGFVEELFVTTGDNVQQGAPIVRFNSEEENRDLLKTRTQDKARKAMLNRLKPEQKKISRRVAEVAVEIAAVQIDYKTKIVQVQNRRFEVGLTSAEDLWKAELDLEVAKKELDKAQAQLTILDFTNETDLEVDQYLTAAYQPEVDGVERRIRRLTVTSPATGTVNLLVGIGSFCRLGQIVARIDQEGTHR